MKEQRRLLEEKFAEDDVLEFEENKQNKEDTRAEIEDDALSVSKRPLYLAKERSSKFSHSRSKSVISER